MSRAALGCSTGDRPAPARTGGAGLDGVDFLIREAATRLVERLADVRRRFPLALELGCHTGQLARHSPARADRPLIQADLAPAMAQRPSGRAWSPTRSCCRSGRRRFDLVLSCFSLHWVNDLPGTLAQIRHALKPDGLFLAALPGGTTLMELREALLRAELEASGGAACRVSPFVDLRDAGMLLQRAGFALPVADVETLTVTYDHPLKLMAELRAMGEANALADRPRRPLGRATSRRACAIYQERFADVRGRVPATFQLLTLSGWKPDPDQPQPLRRGSGQVSLARALGVPVEVLEGKTKRPPR